MAAWYAMQPRSSPATGWMYGLVKGGSPRRHRPTLRTPAIATQVPSHADQNLIDFGLRSVIEKRQFSLQVYGFNRSFHGITLFIMGWRGNLHLHKYGPILATPRYRIICL